MKIVALFPLLLTASALVVQKYWDITYRAESTNEACKKMILAWLIKEKQGFEVKDITAELVAEIRSKVFSRRAAFNKLAKHKFDYKCDWHSPISAFESPFGGPDKNKWYRMSCYKMWSYWLIVQERAICFKSDEARDIIGGYYEDSRDGPKPDFRAAADAFNESRLKIQLKDISDILRMAVAKRQTSFVRENDTWWRRYRLQMLSGILTDASVVDIALLRETFGNNIVGQVTRDMASLTDFGYGFISGDIFGVENADADTHYGGGCSTDFGDSGNSFGGSCGGGGGFDGGF